MAEANSSNVGKNWVIFLAVGAVALIACMAGGISMNPKQFFHSYLMGYMFWVGLTIGSLGLLMIQHLTGGRWAFVIRRSLESAASPMNLMLMLVLFLPVVFLGMPYLYEWVTPEGMADKYIHMKSPYLNKGFFTARLVGYFLLWASFSFFLGKWSLEQDKAPSVDHAKIIAKKCEKLSAPALLIMALTITFASVDWVMSLNPHWTSTIFGILTMGGMLLNAMAFSIIIIVKLSGEKPLAGLITKIQYHDLGKLMMAFVLLWSYFSLSQFLIIWSGNLPEETIFYLNRDHGVWEYIGIGLILFHFAFPFFILIPKNNKRKPERLWKIATFILFMRFVDLFWIIKPQVDLKNHSFTFYWTDILAPIGIGGIWLGVYFFNLKQKPLLPENDPFIDKEHMGHGH